MAETPPESRDEQGRFKPGTSGNPGGRPKTAPEVRAAAQRRGLKAVRTLARLLDHADPAERRQAAIALLDRGYGKPSQDVNLGAQDSLAEAIARAVAGE